MLSNLGFKSIYSKYLKRNSTIIYPEQKRTKKKVQHILIPNLVGKSQDLQPDFENIRKRIIDNGLLILTSVNPIWGRVFGFKSPKTPLIYLWFLENIADISGYKVIKSGYLAIPETIPVLSFLLNSILPKIPKVRRLLPYQFLIAQATKHPPQKEYSVSVIIPTFNEEDNVADCIKHVPKMGRFTEIIIADDGSNDKTINIATKYKKKNTNLRILKLPHRGKVWAVKAGFEKAKGEILMVWDADRTVPAHELIRFYRLFSQGQAEYAHGTRLAYPMEKEAMKLLNLIGNLFFGWLYSLIFNTQITDTLCGTKVIFKKHLKKIQLGTEPWGDFDLLFGAKRLGLTMKEIPIHYKTRVAGKSKMKTLRYGMVVAKMSAKAFWEFKVLKLFTGKLLLISIIALAIFVRFTGLIPNLPYHPDEGYIQKASYELFINILTSGDFEPKAYKYGSIVLYVQALVYLPFLFLAYALKLVSFISSHTALEHQTFAGFFENLVSDFKETIFWAQRASTATFGVLSVVLVYIISKNFFNKYVGLLAALIFSVAPSHVRSSHWVTTDILSLFGILLALYFMIKVFKTSSLKWYVLSGFTIGIVSSIRYFPIALLVYPIASLYDPNKTRAWLLKSLAGLFFILPGFIFSTPFLLFSGQSQQIFNDEMTNHVLPFYGTAVSAFATLLGKYIVSLGQSPFPDITTLNPSKFYPYYSSFLVFSGFGVFPTIIALAGAGITLVRYPRQFLFLVIVPFVNWFYISFYMHAAYDRLIIPTLPFLSIFIGVLLYKVWEVVQKRVSRLAAIIVVIIIASLSLYYPAKESISSSLSCSKPTVFKEAELWIDKNISVDAKIAHIPIFMFPSKPYSNLLEIQPNTIFFPEELKEEKFEYIFMNTSRFGYNLYPFYTDFFIRPEEMYQNNYLPLVLKSYESQTEPVMKVTRSRFCDPTELLIFKLPYLNDSSKTNVASFNFSSKSDLAYWHTQIFDNRNRVKVSINSNEGHTQPGSLEIFWDQIAYNGPRIYSQSIPVEPGKTYFLSGWIKSLNDLEPNERDGFLRLDFYNSKENVILPGGSVILTKRFVGDSEWREVKATGIAPEWAKFAIISAQIAGTKTSNSFYFDDIKLGSN